MHTHNKQIFQGAQLTRYRHKVTVATRKPNIWTV